MSNYFIKKSFFIFLYFCTLHSAYAMDSKIVQSKIIGLFSMTIVGGKKFIQSLIFYPREILSRYDYRRYSSFCRADRSGNLSEENLQTIKWYLDKGKVSLFDQALKSIIVNKYSAKDEHLVIDLVNRLMKNNAKIDGETPLTLAVKHSKSNLITSLLECNPALVNARNNDGHTPLSIILNNVSQEENDTPKEINKIMFEKLVQGGLDINPKYEIEKDTKIPLIKAIAKTNLKQVKFLLENGANANCNNHTKPLAIIISKILYENDISQKNNYAILEQLLEHGLEINSPIRSGKNTALVEAIINENLGLVEFLLAKRADVNVGAPWGSGPIYFAMRQINNKGDQEVKYKILEKLLGSAQLKVDESLPLIEAVNFQNLRLIRFLLQKYGTCINLPDENGHTPLVRAIIKGQNLEIIKLLIESKADLNPQIKHISLEYTPLVWAVKEQNLGIIKLLIESKADLNSQEAYSPLFPAVESKNCDLVGLLLDNKANINSSDKLFSIAKETNNFKMIQYLLNRGVGVTEGFSNNLGDTFNNIENCKLEL